MAATSTVLAGSGEPDMVLIGELLEEIARHPPAVYARKLLIEHYISVGWLDAARENVDEVKKHTPNDLDVKEWQKMLKKKSDPKPQAIVKPVSTPKPVPVPRPAVLNEPSAAPAKLPADLDVARDDLSTGYKSLQKKAGTLLSNLSHLKYLSKKQGRPLSANISKREAITSGELQKTTSEGNPPGSARSVVRKIQLNPNTPLEVIITDMEDMMKWLRAKNANAHNDTIREALVKRVQALESAFPDNLKMYPEVALMHIEHEHLGKVYVTDETMLGDKVSDILRENFWVTEDNYAWDMEELAQAITANGGIMRNPLSRQMFTPKDIRGIVAHPAGKQLAALQLEQHELSKGIRPGTVDQMEKLAATILEDQSTDSLPSRYAVDEFLAYCATLPEAEQKAIEGLRCPARDSHTGQAYDFTIGEAVRDAKGNRVCFHKTGDFIKQAAFYLRQNRGVPPDPDGKCVVM
ncbi:hypothetical protein GQ43DRAFT_301150 [Delitschia confertaspora ATCC 74209]|uniref:Uncharacterized protein n=1 Tax=Delitschia confertaspora ATCC 74209 TaxID=1513339 RepID=A0A9P4JQX2_9PLEO|nr:hypothetical protein GQ43DRAFT_301150 [Delitschia confertaspora ATCC 74209]